MPSLINKIEIHFKDWNDSPEFPDLYHKILYESGGDFLTYSKLLGYNDYQDFLDDYNKIENTTINKKRNTNEE
jgi:hypothetical protein